MKHPTLLRLFGLILIAACLSLPSASPADASRPALHCIDWVLSDGTRCIKCLQQSCPQCSGAGCEVLSCIGAEEPEYTCPG